MGFSFIFFCCFSSLEIIGNERKISAKKKTKKKVVKTQLASEAERKIENKKKHKTNSVVEMFQSKYV